MRTSPELNARPRSQPGLWSGLMRMPTWLILLTIHSALAAQQIPGFEEKSEQLRLGFVHAAGKTGEKYLIETMGGGVAMFDADGDRRLDLLFVNGGHIQLDEQGPRVLRDDPKFWNRLYRNRPDGAFEDVTSASGLSAAQTGKYGMGAATGDYDNDGDTDLLITGYPQATLYRNDGKGRFDDVTAESGVRVPGWSSSAGFFDADADGDLDLFVVRYLDWSFAKHIECDVPVKSYCEPQRYEPIASMFFRNQGDGAFTDDSAPAGIAAHPGKGLGVAFHDADADGDLDVLVANDSEPQQLFLNDGHGAFVEDALLAGLAYNEEGGTFAGMGIVWADADNDLLPDVVITNLAREFYAYYQNDGDGQFLYRTRQSQLARISARSSGWGVYLLDHDLDGQKDLFVAQSHVLDTIRDSEATLRYKQPPLLALGHNGVFVDVSAKAGPAFREPVAARGAAFGDLDNDGDVDVAMALLDGRPRVLLNNASATGNHWLQVELQGRDSPRDGQGAIVRVTTAAGTQQRFASTAGSYLSANDPRVHFGLGENAIVKVLQIQWPSGIEQEVLDVTGDQVVRVVEPSP